VGIGLLSKLPSDPGSLVKASADGRTMGPPLPQRGGDRFGHELRRTREGFRVALLGNREDVA
jgi:hypothetical protein